MNLSYCIMFRVGDEKKREHLQTFIGLLLVCSCNLLVIIGIISGIGYLLIPWLIFHCIGKNYDTLNGKHFVARRTSALTTACTFTLRNHLYENVQKCKKKSKLQILEWIFHILSWQPVICRNSAKVAYNWNWKQNIIYL